MGYCCLVALIEGSRLFLVGNQCARGSMVAFLAGSKNNEACDGETSREAYLIEHVPRRISPSYNYRRTLLLPSEPVCLAGDIKEKGIYQ